MAAAWLLKHVGFLKFLYRLEIRVKYLNCYEHVKFTSKVETQKLTALLHDVVTSVHTLLSNSSCKNFKEWRPPSAKTRLGMK